MRPFIVYWNNIPSPYMVDRFNAVADRDAFDFEAWFNDRTEPDRTWLVDESSWRFPYRYVPSLALSGLRVHFPTPLLHRRPDVLVSLYAQPVFLAGWSVAKLRGSKTAFWCQVTHDSWVERRAWKERLKRYVFRRVDATLGSGEDSRAFAMRYGVRNERALTLPHSIDVAHFRNGARAGRAARDEGRQAFGLKGTVFLYVGRLWWGKGLNYLLEAFHAVQVDHEGEVSLLFVGDGPDEQELQDDCAKRGLRNVVFAGFRQKADLPRIYALADVFVFPTLGDPYGLVIDEAMACALPVISTTAAGEVRDRVIDGVTGHLVPPRDAPALARRMIEAADMPDAVRRMGQEAAARAARHTPEHWAANFEDVVRFLLEQT